MLSLSSKSSSERYSGSRMPHRVKAFAITVILKFRIVLGLLFRTHDFYIVTDPADRK